MKNSSYKPVRYLSSKNAAEYLTISERKLRYLRSAGEIKAVRISKGRIAYRIVDLDRFIDNKINNHINYE